MKSYVSERQTYLDAVAGFLIIYMILGHIFQKAEMTDTAFYKNMDVLYFFLPWFFFKSGMFYKESTIKDFITKSGKKLLSEYVIWSLVGTVVLAFVEFAMGTFEPVSFASRFIRGFYNYEAVPGNLALWFLIALFCSRFLFILLKRLFSTDIIMLLSLSIVVLNYILDIHAPLWVVNIPAGLLFYSLGARIGNLHENKYVSLSLMILFVVLWLLCPSFVGFRSMTLLYGNFFIFIIGSICGIFGINYIFQRLPKLSVLEYVGKNSMLYYVIHWPVLSIGALVAFFMGIEDKATSFFVLCITEIVALLIVTAFKISKTQHVNPSK